MSLGKPVPHTCAAFSANQLIPRCACLALLNASHPCSWPSSRKLTFLRRCASISMPAIIRMHKAAEPAALWVKAHGRPPLDIDWVVERRRIELPTSALRTRRSPS